MANEKNTQDPIQDLPEDADSVARQIDALRSIKAEEGELGHDLLEDVSGGGGEHVNSTHISSTHTNSIRGEEEEQTNS